MTYVLRTLLVIAAVSTWSGAASAQTADEIIEKHLKALGGREALGKLQSRIITGAISVSTPNGEFSGEFSRYDKVPNKSRAFTKLDLGSVGMGEMTRDQRFDGTSGLVIDSLNGNSEIAGSQLDALRNNIFPSVYLNYKERGATVDLEGKDKVNGKDVNVLRFSPKTGASFKHFIDAETFLLVKAVTKLNTPQTGEIEQTAEFQDFRDVDGVKVPFRTKTSSSVQNLSITVKKVEHNQPIDDSMFVKPSK